MSFLLSKRISKSLKLKYSNKSVLDDFFLIFREKMAFFTRVNMKVPILPGEEIRSESSTLTRGESLFGPEAEEESGDDEIESSDEEEEEKEEEERGVEGEESKVVMDSSEVTKVDEDSRTVEGSEALEPNKENQRFDYVVDRILGVEV